MSLQEVTYHTAGQSNWMIPVSTPFVQAPFVGLRIYHTQQVGSLGWGLG
jgi:hypothetical protein